MSPPSPPLATVAAFGDGYVPDTVYLAIRRSGRAAVLMPSKGVGVGASSKAFAPSTSAARATSTATTGVCQQSTARGN